jgi:TonB family protein
MLPLLLLLCLMPVVGGQGQDASLKPEENSAVISAVAPVYPRLARLTKTSGRIRVEVQVDNSGTVIYAKAIREDANSYSSFKGESEKAAMRWRFTEANTGTPRVFVLTFQYKLMPDKSGEDELTSVYHIPLKIEVRSTAVNPLIIEDPPVYGGK